MRSVATALTLSASLVVGACTNSVDSATPQAAASGYRDAMLERDWERAFAFLTRDAQASAVGGMYLSAAFGAQTDPALAQSFAKIVTKYGLDRRDTKFAESEDLAAIFSEITGWVDDNLSGEAGQGTAKMLAQIEQTRFENFEISGQRASADMITPSRSRRVKFTKVDGRWRMGI